MRCAQWNTAIHEASHAVVAHEFRRTITFATVVPSGQSLGRTTIPSIFDWQDIDIGDGLNPKLRRKVDKRQRQALGILVAGDVGNFFDRNGAWQLVSHRMPGGIFDQLMGPDHHAAVAALQEKADVTRALEMAVDLPSQGMEEIKRAEERIGRILKQRWRRVIALAARLCKREEMQQQEIEAVFR
jgi:hypothetical protein